MFNSPKVSNAISKTIKLTLTMLSMFFEQLKRMWGHRDPKTEH